MKVNTKMIGQKIIEFDVLPSTQEYIKNLEKKGDVFEGEVIIANRQTAGIGTHERKWFTGKNDNLAFSFVLFPNCHISKLDKLTIIIAECFLQAIKELYLIRLQIKEPNDLIYKDKKMGGILTECITEGEVAKKIFIGIGFNVNQAEFPGNLSNIATSLKKEFQADFSKEDILIRFLEIFEKRYLQLIK